MAVTFEKNRWRARVNDGGERISLGMFDTKRKAQLAITRWKQKHEFPDSWRDSNNIMTFEDIPMSKPKKDKTDKPTPKEGSKPKRHPFKRFYTSIKDKYETFMKWLEKQVVS